MTSVDEEVRDRWTKIGQPVNINHEMVRLTVSVISRSMFREDIVDATSKVDIVLQTILAQSVQRMPHRWICRFSSPPRPIAPTNGQSIHSIPLSTISSSAAGRSPKAMICSGC